MTEAPTRAPMAAAMNSFSTSIAGWASVGMERPRMAPGGMGGYDSVQWGESISGSLMGKKM